jgi:hypothetical protein
MTEWAKISNAHENRFSVRANGGCEPIVADTALGTNVGSLHISQIDLQLEGAFKPSSRGRWLVYLIVGSS